MTTPTIVTTTTIVTPPTIVTPRATVGRRLHPGCGLRAVRVGREGVVRGGEEERRALRR